MTSTCRKTSTGLVEMGSWETPADIESRLAQACCCIPYLDRLIVRQRCETLAIGATDPPQSSWPSGLRSATPAKDRDVYRKNGCLVDNWRIASLATSNEATMIDLPRPWSASYMFSAKNLYDYQICPLGFFMPWVWHELARNVKCKVDSMVSARVARLNPTWERAPFRDCCQRSKTGTSPVLNQSYPS